MGDLGMDETATPISARDLRVSDAEREHVADLLNRAVGRGLLDLDEFTERTDTALNARTRAELNAVLTDLPGLVHRDAFVGSSVGSAPSGSETLELKAHGSSLNRKGRWIVPARVVVRNKYGGTHLDFTEAEFQHPRVDVELDSKWGSVELVVPSSAGVDADGITEVKWGSLEDKSQGPHGSPLIVVSGRVHGGSLKIRPPRWNPFRT